MRLRGNGRARALAIAGAVAGAVGVAGAAGAGAAGAQEAPRGRVTLAPGQRVALVTGSTDGLGREVARRLADSGLHVVVHGRNRERGAAVVREIEQRGRGSARFYPADLASLAEVRALAAAVARDYPRLDVLVNNAGIWRNDRTRLVSADGHELHFAVNYLAGYALTHELLPLLRRSAPARVVNVASAAQRAIDFDDVMLERGYGGARAYAQSKLAQVMFTLDLARALEGSGVTVNALHPATLMNTTMVAGAGIPARSTVDEGAAAVVRLVLAPDVGSGRYYDGTREARADPQAYDAAARERLRTLSDRLTRERPARGRRARD